MHFLQTETYRRAAAVILGSAQVHQNAEKGPAEATAPTSPSIAELSHSRATERPTQPPAPQVVVRVPGFQSLEDAHDLAGLRDGPRRLLKLLHQLAVDVAKVRGYSAAVSQVVIHQSQELQARALGVHRVTLWRWTQVLQERGHIEARAHKATTTHRAAAVTRNDGTLYAVSLKAGHRARLRYDDLKHRYRDLEADRKAGNTAFQALQQSHPSTGREWVEVLRAWAVTPGNTTLNPVNSVDCCIGPNTVQDVVYTLPLLAEAHPTKRAGLVGIMAATLARALNDQHSRKWWCQVIWNAWTDEVEGRAGLQVLAAQLARLDVDRREWEGLKNPAALLTARLNLSMH
ncbi:hypothetical protein ACTQ9L_16305 [Deinococcus wulumuqiensis]